MPRHKQEEAHVRVLISIPDEFLTQVDGVAKNEHRSRSELIREALRTYIRAVEVNHELVGDAS